MRKRFFWFAALAWPLLILTVVPGLQAPLIAHPTQPIKPLRVWTAVVSWYGPHFHGRKTASGQTYNMFAPTAAHAWLPLGSLVRLVNVKTGQTQVVRVNDRGPVNDDDREMDVSFMAATRLGLLERGVARFRLELLQEPKRP